MTTHTLININTASVDELIAVPRIGPALAKRIIDYRPYQEMKDLIQVPGISEKSLQELTPYLTLETQELTTINPQLDTNDEFYEEDGTLLKSEEAEVLPAEENDVIALPAKTEPEPDNNHDPLTEEGLFYDLPEEENMYPETAFATTEDLKEKDTTNEEKPSENDTKDKEPETLPSYVTRQQFTWSIIAAVVGSVILTIALILGILAFINGDLRYATWNDAKHLGNQVSTLSERSDTLQADANQMRQRMDAMETIAGRVTMLEETTQTMQDDLSEAQNQLQNTREMITEVQKEMVEFQKRIDQYNNAFLGIYNAVLPLVEPMLEGGQNK